MADLASKDWQDALLWVSQNMTEIRREAMAAFDDPEIIDATLSHFLHANIPTIIELDLDIDVEGGWMYPKIRFGREEEWQATIRVTSLPNIYAEFIAIAKDTPNATELTLAVLEKHGQNIERYKPK